MYTKYLKSLELMNAAIQAINSDDNTIEDFDAGDRLFEYILANFPAPTESTFDEDVASCQEILNMPASEIEEKLYKIPPVILDNVWPIAIARFLIREQVHRIDDSLNV